MHAFAVHDHCAGGMCCGSVRGPPKHGSTQSHVPSGYVHGVGGAAPSQRPARCAAAYDAGHFGGGGPLDDDEIAGAAADAVGAGCLGAPSGAEASEMPVFGVDDDAGAPAGVC